MKKRRELDALVNGKLSRTGKRGSKHELLRNESESSEVEEFSAPEKGVIRKRNAAQACSMCMTVCWAFLLVSCLVSVAGLVWVHVELKKDVDKLQARFQTTELSSLRLPEDMQVLGGKLQDLSKTMDVLNTGDGGVKQLQANLSAVLVQLSLLDATVKSLSSSLATAPQLQSLPKQVKDLSKSVADMGSTVETLQQSSQHTDDMYTTLNERVVSLETQIHKLQEVSVVSSTPSVIVASTKPVPPPDDGVSAKILQILIQQEIARVSSNLNSINLTLSSDVARLAAQSVQCSTLLSVLDNKTSLLDSRLIAVESQSDGADVSPQSRQALTNLLATMMSDFRNSTTQQQEKLKADLDDAVHKFYLQNVQQQSDVLLLSSSVSALNQSVWQAHHSTNHTVQTVDDATKTLSQRVSALEQRVAGMHDIPKSSAEPEITTLQDVTADSTVTQKLPAKRSTRRKRAL